MLLRWAQGSHEPWEAETEADAEEEKAGGRRLRVT